VELLGHKYQMLEVQEQLIKVLLVQVLLADLMVVAVVAELVL
jgi:hypothetical protein